MTWRLLALTGTIVVVWVWTGRLVVALTVGSVEALGKMALYYLHERGWMHVRFGRRAVSPPRS